MLARRTLPVRSALRKQRSYKVTLLKEQQTKPPWVPAVRAEIVPGLVRLSAGAQKQSTFASGDARSLLNPDETANLIAYILSLRRQR